jgi:site-specific DNA-adenine methylase
MHKDTANSCTEVALHSTSNLLSHIMKIRSILHSEDDPCMAISSLEDAISSAKNITEFLEAAKKTLLPKRSKRPTGLKVTPQDLVKFDPDYFHYFDPDTEEGKSDFYKHQHKDKDALHRHLATWVFDDGDTQAALREIKKSFGIETAKTIREKLRNRDHDT